MYGKISKWIWYCGDFELYHSLKMQARREEYDYAFPPFWKIDDCWHNVKFKKELLIDEEENVIVYAHGSGMLEVDGKRMALNRKLTLPKGRHTMIVYLVNPNGLPSIYVTGNMAVSDESWQVSCYGENWVNAGCSDQYTSPDDNPQIFKFSSKEIFPSKTEEIHGGVLYDFGKETFAKLIFEEHRRDIKIYYGESREEALDTEYCYLRDCINAGQDTAELPGRAFRYIFIPGSIHDYHFRTDYEYLPLEKKGTFHCGDELINQIWEVSAYTFHLNSREFFLDGIKRDRWIWSGDAYQSYMINRYLFFDPEICKRTILALRGKDPVEKHINTILDYSFYWIMSVYDYYEMTADADFVACIYPKMKSLIEFCLSRLDENGFAVKVDDDWIFIDWADIDKTGAVCAEQMLFARSLEAMAECSRVIGVDGKRYSEHASELKNKINQFFWCEEKGAYIDSFVSGKNNITRHANIFAVLFGYADDRQKRLIIENVLLNDAVCQIKTPYFKFYELEALCRIGELNCVLDRMKDYWGGMLEQGATAFWEEYNPSITGDLQYKMYGDKFGKSLCHAWGASPIYLIGRYFLGLRPTAPGYKNFEVKPKLERIHDVEAVMPVNGGSVSIKKKDGIMEVCADCEGGKLIYNGREYTLEKDCAVIVREI